MSSEPLIVTFADSQYLPLLAIWLGRLEQLGLRRIRIYALDRATLEWCRGRGVDAAQVPWQGNLRDLWVQRIRIFRALLEAGEEIIHSDTDAIWIRNPLEAGAARQCAQDLVFSQGTVWPVDVHGAWGFVLCCGWFWMRPSAGVRAFFTALEADVQVSGDDQMSVNRVLARAGAKWSHGPAGDYQLAFNGRMIQCWSQAVSGTLSGFPLRVALLPHCEFQRLPEASDRAIVKHFVTPKNCEQKLTVFRHFGLIP